MLVRQRPQGLRQHRPAGGEHRELAAARADDLALDADVVAEVDVGLPLRRAPPRRPRRARASPAARRCRRAAWRSTACRRCARAPPGRRPRPGRRSWCRARGRGAPRGARRACGARERDRIGLDPAVAHPVELVPAYPHLLRQVVEDSRRLVVGSLTRPRLPTARAGGFRTRLRAKTRRRPIRVSHGSWTSTTLASSSTSGARPPVAITVTSSGSPSGPTIAAAIRVTTPSTWPAKPYRIPDCSASTVVRPITDRGRASSTRCSWAPRRPSASTEISMPGAIAPPRYSPAADTASNVVAVPKSTTIARAAVELTAASALTTRSVPTSLGLSVRTGTPVRTPGSTITAGRSPK